MTDRTDRPIDIAIFGATGFTGRFIVEYFAAHYAELPDRPRWALAGRDADRLRAVRDLCGAPADTPILIADIDDEESVAALARQTKVVLATTGPFARYGEPMVKACIAAGTDYADLAGEPFWLRNMFTKYRDSAAGGRARIAFCAGYDCIPAELGVMLLQQQCIERFGGPAQQVDARIQRFSTTGPSGGSAATSRAMRDDVAADASLRTIFADPYALTLEPGAIHQPQTTGPEWDGRLGAWIAPSVMAFINSKVVHAHNKLLGYPYGRDFIYHEAAFMGAGPRGRERAERQTAILRTFAADAPLPGEGPPREDCLRSAWSSFLVGRMTDGRSLTLDIEGRYDAGYASTARMIAETGMALLHSEGRGGLGFPGVHLGEALINRLRQHAEVRFAIKE